ncbi:MAG: type II toxin-antitoxin system CcdA family antitoxin [Polyangiaceae bacterium]|nr:type II toxin-antitoxin system CcdA family antitoxin [Polyangiaceae bacterium]
MTAAKRKISVSLDAELVAELEASEVALSTQVNEAVRDALARRRRQRLLGELLADLDRRHGKVAEATIAKYEALHS